MKNTVFQLASLLLISGLVSVSVGAGSPQALMSEDFDGEGKKGFAAKALAHPNIRLAKGAGPNGSNAIRVAYVGSKKGSERVTGKYPLGSAVDEATLSFDVRFDKDFQWTHGGKLHGLGPKNPITGGESRQPDGWSARITFKEDGKCATYLYDQSKGKKYGVGDTTDKPVFLAGKWHHVTLQVSLNDPGKSNGFAKILIDGKTVMTTGSMVFRRNDGRDTQIQQFLFSTFHGGSSSKWTPVDKKGNPTTVYAFFDNFLVTKGIQQGKSSVLGKPRR